MSGLETCVYLVGAGPGDPGLITLRAKELLEAADCVVYDYLASSAVLAYANPKAKRMFVGKKGFSQHVTQDQINACLVDEATTCGGRIVRLKGGDPFVFGRGGEEALALRAAGVPFEVVPGVTAGVAAPAYAGIPVTHRGMSCAVTLVTGHETPDKPESALNWDALAHVDGTLCFYMGVRDLPMIVENLCAAGKPKDTPVALVRWGTTHEQVTLTATLETVVERVQQAGFAAPAIIVVGQVAALRGSLAWFEDKPLFGRRVVVTRSRAQASVLTQRLHDAGAIVEEVPAIEIVPRAADARTQAVIAHLSAGAYSWCVFTSANGVETFFAQLAACGCDARAFCGCKLAAIGPATAAALAAHGLQADLVPGRFIAESVAEALIAEGVGAGEHVLLPRAAAARDALVRLLSSAGACVDELPVYDTVQPENPDEAQRLVQLLQHHQVDAITFTSSSTVKNFCALLEDAGGTPADVLAGVALASIGPVTSNTLRGAGVPPTVEASEYTIDGLVSALVCALAPREGE